MFEDKSGSRYLGRFPYMAAPFLTCLWFTFVRACCRVGRFYGVYDLFRKRFDNDKTILESSRRSGSSGVLMRFEQGSRR